MKGLHCILYNCLCDTFSAFNYIKVNMLNGPEIISKFLGESEKNLRLVANCILIERVTEERFWLEILCPVILASKIIFGLVDFNLVTIETEVNCLKW